MSHLSRRQFLASTAAASALAAAPAILMPAPHARAAQPVTINAVRRVIEVDGKPANVFGLTQPDGSHGLIAEAGQRFRVRLQNQLDEPTLIHWHGLTPPTEQDGVPDLSQPLLEPGRSYSYDFPLTRPGTNWMHSHHGLQEQLLLAAPLIVRDPAEAKEDMQEVVVMLHDFTFRDPADILAGLQGGGHGGHAGHGAPAGHAGQGGGHAGHSGHAGHGAPESHAGHGGGHAGHAPGEVHLHDVEYDAFLANDRTLDDPQTFRVERGGRVRLRIINAASATNFWLDLDRLTGRLIAVDGMPVEPLAGQRFELAISQRLEIVLQLPREEGAWPVFAVREGERARTGFVLATRGGTLARLAGEADKAAPAIGLDLERRLRAANPLTPRAPDRRHTMTITEGPGYAWMLNGARHGEDTPLEVRKGERVEITFVDRTPMAHPMHLHGHHFQVIAIDGKPIAGAMRDTVLTPAQGSVTIAFDANNPGRWALHCHHLYHMAGGMMTSLVYRT